jgi:hypothetical protein
LSKKLHGQYDLDQFDSQRKVSVHAVFLERDALQAQLRAVSLERDALRSELGAVQAKLEEANGVLARYFTRNPLRSEEAS